MLLEFEGQSGAWCPSTTPASHKHKNCVWTISTRHPRRPVTVTLCVASLLLRDGFKAFLAFVALLTVINKPCSNGRRMMWRELIACMKSNNSGLYCNARHTHFPSLTVTVARVTWKQPGLHWNEWDRCKSLVVWTGNHTGQEKNQDENNAYERGQEENRGDEREHNNGQWWRGQRSGQLSTHNRILMTPKTLLKPKDHFNEFCSHTTKHTWQIYKTSFH